MSGAEALVVINIITNVVALVGFSRRVVSQVREYGEKADEVPEAFRDIETTLPLFANTLSQVQWRVERKDVGEDSCRALSPVLKGCERKLEQLKAIFEDVLVQKNASKLERGWKAIKSARKEKEVKEIVQTLDRFALHLNPYNLRGLVGLEDMQLLTSAMASTSVEQPAAKPPKTYFMVPVQVSNEFTGRQEVMASLEESLCLDDQYSRLALIGLGGMGKTKIALQYAQRFKSHLEVSVFWVYAGTVERFKNAYRQIARKLGIPGSESPEANILELVKERLESADFGKWLMILDNADDEEIMYGQGSARLCQHLPRSYQGSILLTSRFGHVGRKFAKTNIIELPSMTLADSTSLLISLLGNNFPYTPKESCIELVEELSRTPLAIVQAASFMLENDVSLNSYLDMFRQSDTSQVRLLSEDFEDEVRDPQSKNPIATTWVISFEYIRSHFPQAAELLSIMSMADAQAIPEFLIQRDGEDVISFSKAIGTLRAFCFITERQKSEDADLQSRLFDLHRLVRLAMRNWLKTNHEFHQCLLRTVEIFTCKSYHREESLKYSISSLIMPHIMEILKADQLQPSNGTMPLSEILSNLNLWNDGHLFGDAWNEEMGSDDKDEDDHSENGDSAEGIDDAENDNDADNGKSDDDVDTKALNHASELLCYASRRLLEISNPAQAKIYATKSLQISTQVGLEGSGAMSDSIGSLANILEYMGGLNDAEQLRRIHLRFSEAKYGKYDVRSLRSLRRLYLLITIKSKEQGACKARDLLLKRLQKYLLLNSGKEDPFMLLNAGNGQIFYGNLAEAESYFALSLQRFQAIHSDRGYMALDGLADTYRRQSKFNEAERTQRQALEAAIRFKGPKSLLAILYRISLSKILVAVGKNEEAKIEASISLNLTQEIHGPTSKKYLLALDKYRSIPDESGK
ncbi:hypothetical protein HO133_005205 [Letharia lupina]|uniref:NB-ARC domain-containing protein n=1 Tax=Letharia lupina TaxID=560253 RepID=A0A8H6F9B2_9LECA|nr:uncharacterized protein HO133_005205 [Letharia lupina]KAF6219379.1 hypothetical protein HO133_005205 [Letharia lupina]